MIVSGVTLSIGTTDGRFSVQLDPKTDEIVFGRTNPQGRVVESVGFPRIAVRMSLPTIQQLCEIAFKRVVEETNAAPVQREPMAQEQTEPAPPGLSGMPTQGG